MSRPRLRVAVQRAVRGAALPSAPSIRRWAAAAAEAAGESALEGELTVRIVGERESAALNERYRARSGPTNVLAFAAGAGDALPQDEPRPAGDLVICAPVVEREAREQGKPLEAHFAHIVVHGTLHLAGLDHDDDAAAAVMEDRERQVLAALGFPDPYAEERAR